MCVLQCNELEATEALLSLSSSLSNQGQVTSAEEALASVNLRAIQVGACVVGNCYRLLILGPVPPYFTLPDFSTTPVVELAKVSLGCSMLHTFCHELCPPPGLLHMCKHLSILGSAD